MSEILRYGLAVIFLLFGFISIGISVLGVFRYRFVLTRMQAAAIIDTLGLFFLLAGLMLLAWDLAYIPKLFLILAFQWIGSPIAAHMVGRMEIRTEKELKKHMVILDEREISGEKEEEE